MTQTEALKMALEALKDNQHLIADNERHAYVMEYNSIIEKCEEALAQQSNEQVEPVAYRSRIRNRDGQVITGWVVHLERTENPDPRYEIEPLFAHPPVPTAQPKEPEQDPVAYFNPQKGGFYWAKPTTICAPYTVNVVSMPLYTTPPQRKPLTRGQIREIEVDVSLNPSFDYITPAEQLCRAIEAAHGIKE